jgi:hypothetical protein
VVSLRDAQPVLADLTVMLEQATCGTRPAQGSAEQRVGPTEFPDGAAFSSSGGLLVAHPPWKNTPGSGETFAKFSCTIPANAGARFLSEVFLDPNAVGPDKSDGVTFIVRATDGQQHVSGQLHQDTAQAKVLELDLGDFRGQTIDLELAVDAGPQHVPTYDWARWRQPRIEKTTSKRRTIAVETTETWQLALTYNGPATITQTGTTFSAETDLPGAIMLLRDRPPVVSLPLDLTRPPDQLFYVLDSGIVANAPQYAGAAPGASQTAGIRRQGLVVHPPNHGRTIAIYLLTLPAQSARLTTYVGLRDGSQSDGVKVSIEVNGTPCVQRLITPGDWHALEVDLARWAGQPIVLGVVTDSAGSFNFDWTTWGEPRLVQKLGNE